MKLLLDEQLPKRLTRAFPTDFEVITVQQAGWSGIGNGALLRLAADAGFAALLSADQNMAYQQHAADLPLAVVVMKSVRIRLPDLLPFVPDVVQLCQEDVTPGFYELVPPTPRS